MTDRRRQALRSPYVVRALGTSLAARLPTAMATLAILLLVAPVHGYAVAGAMCTVFVGASALTSPPMARLVDRIGARPVVLPAAAVNGTGLIVLGSLPTRWPAAEFAAAAVAGLGFPPVSAVARGLWPRLVTADQLPVLFGLEATAQELIYIAGPATVALLAAGLGAHWALVITGILGVAGAVAFVSTPVLGRPPAVAAADRAPRLLGARLFPWVVLAAGLTGAFGMTEVGVVAAVAPGHAGGTAASGAVLAAWSAGSMVGGVWFGRRHRRITDRSLLAAIVTMAALVAVPAVATGPLLLAGLLFVSGLAIAPAIARLYTRLSAVAPGGSQTEAFGWLAVAFILGSAAGAAAGGAAVTLLGAHAALALAAVPPLLAAATSAALLRWAPRPWVAPLPQPPSGSSATGAPAGRSVPQTVDRPPVASPP